MCYIWNEDFDFTPEFIPLDDGKYLIAAAGIPLIEYSRFRRIYSDRNTSRIYWDTSDMSGYDPAKFGSWFKKCADLIKKNAAYTEKGGRINIYCWEDFVKCRRAKRPYWIKNGDFICLNVGTNCINNCANCVRDECIPFSGSNAEETANEIIEDFFEKHNNETVVFGAYSEPLSSDMLDLFLKIIYATGKSTLRKIVITNGLTFFDTISDHQEHIDDIFVLCPASDADEYIEITHSKYGPSSYGILEKFVSSGKKSDLNVHVINAYRNEVLQGIIDKKIEPK